MAIDTVSGMINWVVEGNLIENHTVTVLRDSKIPNKLKGKIILGAFQPSATSWYVLSNKLTNLNIFSGMLTLLSMMRRTNGDA